MTSQGEAAMKSILDLPNEVLLMVFVKTTFPRGLFALSRTCRHFRILLHNNKQSLSMKIAAQNHSLPYTVLGFGKRRPDIPALLLLVSWEKQIIEFGDACDSARQLFVGGQNAIRRAVWYTPLWQEHLQVGLLVYKLLSISKRITKRLEQLPSPFHALLRFTSIVSCDMVRVRFAVLQGGEAISHVSSFLQSGYAPGDRAPWLQNDIGWRTVEITLFERGCKQCLASVNQTNLVDLTGRTQLGAGTVGNLLKTGTLAPERHYHHRLDELCQVYGRVWGGADYWETFDPFGLKDSGLSGSDAVKEMVSRLPGSCRIRVT